MGSDEVTTTSASPSRGLYLQLFSGFGVGAVLFAASLFASYVIFAGMFVGELDEGAAFVMLLVIVASGVGCLRALRARCDSTGWGSAWAIVALLSPVWLLPPCFLILLLMLEA